MQGPAMTQHSIWVLARTCCAGTAGVTRCVGLLAGLAGPDAGALPADDCCFARLACEVIGLASSSGREGPRRKISLHFPGALPLASSQRCWMESACNLKASTACPTRHREPRRSAQSTRAAPL